MYRFLILLLLATPFARALSVDKCNEETTQLIESHIKQSHKPSSHLPHDLDEKYDAVCEIKQIEKSDGLTNTLYHSTETGTYYVKLDNGLDGSFNMYSPFVW